jgi:hypothetical protein
MHRRYEHLNVPVEIVRTVVAVSETGSFSRAGERLGLSQPAVSAQMRRIQNLLGGEFERSMIRERVMAGLSRAKADGTQLGRRRLEDRDADKVAAIGEGHLMRLLPRRPLGQDALQAAAMQFQPPGRYGDVAVAHIVDALDIIPAHASGRY